MTQSAENDPWPTWCCGVLGECVCDSLPDAESGLCPDCGHRHTPDGCTGDPTPSDLWAGVSAAGCDCDFDRVFPPGGTS